jgi:hypothetical protein
MQRVSLSDLKGVEKKALESLKKAGVETLEDLKLGDIGQLGKLTGLSKTLLREILLRAELEAYGVSPSLVNALVTSGSIARGGELAALGVEEIQALVVKGAEQDKGAEVGVEAIEDLKVRVPRMTLDEETPLPVLEEEKATPLRDEAGLALRGEELVVSKPEVETFIGELERTLQQHLEKMRAIMTAPGESIEFADLQSILSSLQVDIQPANLQAMAKIEPDIGVILGEDESPELAHEEIELDTQIQTLSKKLVTVQGQLAELQKRRIAADEEQSPAGAEEGEPTELRGE